MEIETKTPKVFFEDMFKALTEKNEMYAFYLEGVRYCDTGELRKYIGYLFSRVEELQQEINKLKGG